MKRASGIVIRMKNTAATTYDGKSPLRFENWPALIAETSTA